MREISSISLQADTLRTPTATVGAIESVSLETARLTIPVERHDEAIGSTSLSLSGYEVNGTATEKPEPIAPLAFVSRKKRRWYE